MSANLLGCVEGTTVGCLDGHCDGDGGRAKNGERWVLEGG